MTPVELNGYAPHFRKALETVRDQAAARARQEVLASIGEAFVRQAMAAMAAMGGGVTAAPLDLFAKAAAHSPAGGTTINGTFYAGGQFIPAEEMAKASPEEKAELERKQGDGEKGGKLVPEPPPLPTDPTHPANVDAIHAAVAAAIRGGKEVRGGFGGKVIPMSVLRGAVAHLPREQQDEAILEATHRHGFKGAEQDGYRLRLTQGMAGVLGSLADDGDLTLGSGGRGEDRSQRFVGVEVEGGDRDRLLAKHAATPAPTETKKPSGQYGEWGRAVAGGGSPKNVNMGDDSPPALGSGEQRSQLVDVPDAEGDDAFDVRVWTNPTASQIRSKLDYLRSSQPIKGVVTGNDLNVWWDQDVHHQPTAHALGHEHAVPFEDRATIYFDRDADRVTVETHLPNQRVRTWAHANGFFYGDEPPPENHTPDPDGGAADDKPPPPASSDRATKPLSREERAKRAEKAKAAVEKAVADPKSIKPHELRALHGHFLALSKEQQKEYARQLREKVGGTKAELADRLRERIKAERVKKEGTRVMTAKVDTLPADADGSGYEVVGRPALSREAALKMNAGSDVVAVQKRGGKWVALREKVEGAAADMPPAPHPASVPVGNPGVVGQDAISSAVRDQRRRQLIAEKLNTAGAVLPDEAVDHFTHDGTSRVTEGRAVSQLQNVHGLSEQEAKDLLKTVQPSGTVTVGGNRKRPAYAVADIYRAMGKLYENPVTPGGADANQPVTADTRPTTGANDERGQRVLPEVWGGSGGTGGGRVGEGDDAGTGAADRTDARGGEAVPARGADRPAGGVEGTERPVAGDAGRGGEPGRVAAGLPGAAAGGGGAGVAGSPPPLTADETAELSALNRKPFRQLTPGEKARRDELSRKFSANQFPGATPVVMGGGRGPGNNGEQSNEGTAFADRQAAGAAAQPPAQTPATGVDHAAVAGRLEHLADRTPLAAGGGVEAIRAVRPDLERMSHADVQAVARSLGYEAAAAGKGKRALIDHLLGNMESRYMSRLRGQMITGQDAGGG